MSVKLNKIQYILSAVLFLLIALLVLQINYQNKQEVEGFDFVNDQTLFVLRLDLTSQQKNCLLGEFCLINDKENRFLDWLKDDVRHQRIFELIDQQDVSLDRLFGLLDSELYLMGQEYSSEEIECVWLTKMSDDFEIKLRSLLPDSFYIKRQGGWVIFSKSQQVVDSIKSGKLGVFQAEGIEDWPIFGKIYPAKFESLSFMSEIGLFKEEFEKLLKVNELNLFGWFDDAELQFSFSPQTLADKKITYNFYQELEISADFNLEPKLIIENKGEGLGSDNLSEFDFFGINKYCQAQRFFWAGLDNLEDKSSLDSVLSKKQFFIIDACDKDSLVNYKNSFSVDLAKKLPTRKKLTLPDGQESVELVAEPKKFEFEKIEFESYTMEALKEPRNDFELAMAYDDERLILANDFELLQELVKNNRELIERIWLDDSYSDKAYYNFDNRNSAYYGLDSIFIEDLSLKNNLWFRGIIR